MTLTETNVLQQVRAQLSELIEAAKTGALIPVRLPGQLEGIEALLAQAERQPGEKPSSTSPDTQQVLEENAEFFKTAIHELRTPMTSIRGYSDMMNNPGMSGELTEMQMQLLQVIRTNARRMEGLLSDMSYVNKVRSGTLIVNPKMDMFKNIALIVEKKAAPLAEELKRQLEFDIPSGLPYLNTDGELLALALFKLVENGLRYSPEEIGKVTVRGEAEGNTLVITVEDNGIGMTPEEVAKLGTLYYRADSDTVRAYKGSGLGVPIAYGIVEAIKGKIEVNSVPNEGTKFVIRLEGMA